MTTVRVAFLGVERDPLFCYRALPVSRRLRSRDSSVFYPSAINLTRKTNPRT